MHSVEKKGGGFVAFCKKRHRAKKKQIADKAQLVKDVGTPARDKFFTILEKIATVSTAI